MKYTITLLSLASKLQQRPDMLEMIERGLNDSKVLQNNEEPYNSAVISKLAQVYSKTISQMQPRVIVAGQPFHLK